MKDIILLYTQIDQLRIMTFNFPTESGLDIILFIILIILNGFGHFKHYQKPDNKKLYLFIFKSLVLQNGILNDFVSNKLQVGIHSLASFR